MSIKSLAFIAAAVAFTAGSAGAADLNKPAKAAINYVKVCDAYGAGFFYIPGSDTCLKISGYVYVDQFVGGGTYSRQASNNSFYGDLRRVGSPYFTRAAASESFDARTNTQLGLLRSYIELRERWATGQGIGVAPEITLPSAYIQWGGLFAGKMRSAFDFTNPGYTLGIDFASFGTAQTLNQIGYTFDLGNGVTAAVAILDSTTGDANYYASLRNETAGAATALSPANPGYGGNHLPDVVANLAVTQAWGSAMVAAALHEDYSGGTSAANNGSKIGFAFTGGVEFNLPMIAAGDKVALQLGYAQGAIGYITNQNSATGGISRVFAPNVGTATGSNIGEDWALSATGTIKQTQSWGGIYSFSHVFNPNFAFNFDATYLNINGYQNRDAQHYGLLGNIVWTPTGTSDIQIAFEVEYGAATFSSGTKATWGVTNASGLEGGVRLTRTF